MHPAPSLIEASPSSNDDSPHPRPTVAPPPLASPHRGGAHHTPTQSPTMSPPLRKDTGSSVSTQATAATSATGTTSLSVETSNTSYGAETSQSTSTSTCTSPTPHQNIFSVKDGSDVSNHRRANRRRTGPLSQQQREKAALIRKLGACADCRRRRVACHPSHHNMTWEDAMKKFHRHHSPNIAELAPLSGSRRISPAPVSNQNHVNHTGSHHGPNHQGHQSQAQMPNHNHAGPGYPPREGPDPMDIDTVTAGPPGPLPLSDARLRTPLPAGKPLAPIPGIDSLKTELQTSAAKMFSTPHRGRYTSAQALLLSWQADESDPDIGPAIQELAEVLDKQYRYTFQRQKIPSASDECTSPYRWLNKQITDFIEDRDSRDVLKILYYSGHSYLDNGRDMVLASSKDRAKATTIRWSAFQQMLQEATSDVLIIMDAAYFPSTGVERKQGVLELIAAAASEEPSQVFGRCAFTRTLTNELRNKAREPNQSSLSVADLHAKVLSMHAQVIAERSPGREWAARLPSPLHLQISSNPRFPSIQLSRLHRTSLPFGATEGLGAQVHLAIRLKDENIDLESWLEWLRMIPEGIKDVKVDGPFLMR